MLSAGTSPSSIDDYVSTGLRQYAPQSLRRQSAPGWYEFERAGQLVQLHAETGVMTDELTAHADCPGISDATRRRIARKHVEAQIRADLQQHAEARRAALAARRQEAQTRARQQSESELGLQAGLRVAQCVGGILHRSSTRKEAHEEAREQQSRLAALTVQSWARGVSARRAFVAKLRGPIRVFALLGGPGSGKSTYIERLEGEFESLHHISVGQLLRDAISGPVSTRHKKAAMIQVMMHDGIPVPDEIVLELLDRAVSKLRFRCMHAGQPPPTVVLEQFPLTDTQRRMWETNPDLPKFASVIYLDCSEETMIKRVCARSSKTQRSDDNEASVATAISHFQKKCKNEVVAHYQSTGLCTVVDSEGMDLEAGSRALRTALFAGGLARDDE